jgi:hypothetical protein
MNQCGLQYTCAWKQHKESPCIASLSQTIKNAMAFFVIFSFFFNKIREQDGRTGSAHNWGEREGGWPK